jgi:hypothetical protein
VSSSCFLQQRCTVLASPGLAPSCQLPTASTPCLYVPCAVPSRQTR